MDKVIGSIIGIMIIFVMFPMVLTGAHEIQTDEQTDTFASVGTGGGETTASVTLTEDLWDDDPNHVLAITSSISETPTASSYNTTTNALTIAGLVSSSTRTFNVEYEYGGLEDYSGLANMVSFSPLLIFVGILGAIIGGVYMGYRHFRN